MRPNRLTKSEVRDRYEAILVLRNRMGLTLRQVADYLGISAERVRQLQLAAEKELSKEMDNGSQ